MSKEPKVNKRATMESEFDVKDLIIIDNGSDTIKVGISGEDYPRIIIDSICGIPEIRDNDNLSSKQQLLFGNSLRNALREQKHEIKPENPIRHGKIFDITKMTEIWKMILDESLQISEMSQANLLIIDNPCNDKDYKYHIAEAFFEDIKVSSLLFMNSATLSLFSTGLTSGLVVECGHGLSSVTPIFEGFPISHANQSSLISGAEVTNQLYQDLKRNKYDLGGKTDIENLEIVKDIKEKKCSVAYDFEQTINSQDQADQEEKSYELPDGRIITIDNLIRHRACELLFNPGVVAMGDLSVNIQEKFHEYYQNGDKTDRERLFYNEEREKSVPWMIMDSLKRCDAELGAELYRSIVLCGGSSLTKGFTSRLKKEIYGSLKNQSGISQQDLNFVEDTQRRYSSWIGGSMIGSLSTFQNLAISRADYEENPENKPQLIFKRTF